MMNTENVIQAGVYLHKSGSHGSITDRDRAEAGLQLLRQARELFQAADNKRTVARIDAAISSARGAVRIQGYREARASTGATWSCKRKGHHHGPCNSRCKPREAAA